MTLTKRGQQNIVKSVTGKRLIRFLQLILAASTLFIIVFAGWLFYLDQKISPRFENKRFLPPLEFYSAPEVLRKELIFPSKKIVERLELMNFRKRDFLQTLQPEDYTIGSKEQCLGIEWDDVDIDEIQDCLIYRTAAKGESIDRTTISILFDTNDKIIGLYSGTPPEPLLETHFKPQLFAQYINETPILRDYKSLGQTPVQCLDALLAIEDSNFLQHKGVSLTALMRAFIANITSGRARQGGSTITQQLVKNYFLTPEKTLKRKFIELGMALVLEARFTKEDILETYINVIYLGQNGSFQVRGFGAAAKHYFGKKLEQLNLAECSLLAAIVNSPGLFNPFRKPKNAIKRRNKVLRRMTELKMIDEKMYSDTLNAQLPKKPKKVLSEPAPYFVQAVLKQLKDEEIDIESGLRIFTTLDLLKQEAAQLAVKEGLTHIEKRFKNIKKLKEKTKKSLQAVLIAGEPQTGRVQALVGGRNFRRSQYNRAISSHRQVGSVMKPFVYLTALEALDETGRPFNPLSLIDDSKLVHKYDGQTWSPKNYDGEFRGPIPMFYALKESLNVPTAKLGLQVGPEAVVDLARRMGIQSPINPLPSLFLGAYELYPWEVLQAYSGLSRMGSVTPMSLIDRVESLDGKSLWQYKIESQQVVAAENVAVLVGMMKQTVNNGTGYASRLWGFDKIAAGKTGTTNDAKDAWFAGFTPFHTAVVWVGFDDNTPHGLTGASGAIPIWSQYMKRATKSNPDADFSWPEGTEQVEIPERVLLELNAANRESIEQRSIQLQFRSGNTPNYNQ